MGDEDRAKRVFDEFLDRLKSGEEVDPDTYYNRYPELSNALRKLFRQLEDQTKKTSSEPIQSSFPVIIGDFKIIKEIGRGGMGTVYEAQQLSLRRKVALKMLPAHLSYSNEAVKKFRREAEAGGRQSHPGIVSVYAFGEYEGFHYIAQELVEGSYTLADKLMELQDKQILPAEYFPDVAELFIDIADALQHAHDVKVIHRDIKPSNILLLRNGRPKVTDFGLAKIEDALALSRTGDFAGTPYYMSPEQAMSKRIGIDRRTDIYSLGVTLYETLTLKRPFEGKTSHEVLKRIVLIDPVDPHKVNPRVPRDLSTICLKAIEKPPERRYQTMLDLASDLRRYLDGDVVMARPAGFQTRVYRRMKRHPVATVTSGVAFLALICFGIVASLIVLEKERETKAERMKGEAETDVKRLADLEREVEQLWPASPDKIEALTRWVNEAEALLGRLEVHRSNLAALRERARSPEVEMEDPGNLEGEVVEGETARRRTWKLEDPRDQRWHDTLTELVPALELFESEEGGALHKIRSRLGFARSIEKRSIHDHRAAWDRAIASITDREACPYYKGLTLAPLVGFVPIDRDPKTGFWEFVHLQTGEIPERWNDGRIVLTEETGLIFVLIPGGTFIKGTEQSTSRRFEDSPYLDPGMVRNERPARRVNVQPFLMSKYEMTQGQWLRFTGQNPSCYNPDRSNPIWNKHGGPISLLYPVEQVSWADCAEVLSRMNLRLPSESEWEYACRAGSTTLWWTGDEAVSLEGTANLCDLYYKNHGNVPTGVFEEWLNDGFVVTAPVGSFRANPFGLHDVCGNVWEWCQDAYGTYDSTPVDGSSFEPPDARRRICRGGSFFNGAGCCRSAVREYYDQKIGNLSAGLRPACSIVKNGGR